MFILKCEVYLLEQFKSGLQQWWLNTAANSHLLAEIHTEDDALLSLRKLSSTQQNLACLMYDI